MRSTFGSGKHGGRSVKVGNGERRRGAPPCVIAYAHHARAHGHSAVNSSKLPMWALLANNGADLYLVGHAISWPSTSRSTPASSRGPPART